MKILPSSGCLSRCQCSVCSRPHLAPAPSPDAFSPRATAGTPAELASNPSAASGPVASTSKVPYSPPAAVRLPNELLAGIFALARPPLPIGSPRAEPQSPAWKAWAALPLVHSRWHAVASEALAEVVVVHSTKQLKRFIKALGDESLGGKVEELLLDLKEPQCGTGEDGSAAAAKPSTCEALLLQVLARCGKTLKALRWRGFGDPALANLSPSLGAHLRQLEVFEYSPCDASHPPTTKGLMSDLFKLGALKELIVQPSSRAPTPLSQGPSELLDACTRILNVIADITHNDSATIRDLCVQTLAGAIPSRLEALALHSLVVTPPSLMALIVSSFCTLRHLVFSSLLFTGSPVALANILKLVAPSLESFEWSENPSVGRAGSFDPPLSDEQYWDVVRQLTNVRKLQLFGPQVFAPTMHKAGYALPPWLEQLTLGSCDDETVELAWWLDRVEALCATEDGDDAPGSIGEEETAQESEEQVASDESDVGLLDEGEKAAASDDAASTCWSSSSSDSTANNPNDPADPAHPIVPGPVAEDPPSLAHLTPASSPASSPSSSSSPPLSPAPPASPARAASPPPPPPAPARPRRRRISWSRPPPPPSGRAPQLTHLTLCTATTEVRGSSRLVERIDALVRERGVAVEWFPLVVIVLETVELTREMRIEMSAVPDGWA